METNGILDFQVDHFLESLPNDILVTVVMTLISLKGYKGILGFYVLR